MSEEKPLTFTRNRFRCKLVSQPFADLAAPSDTTTADLIAALLAAPAEQRMRVLLAMPPDAVCWCDNPALPCPAGKCPNGPEPESTTGAGVEKQGAPSGEPVSHEQARKASARMRLVDQNDHDAIEALLRYIDQQAAREERADWVEHLLEREKHEHEETKGYRQHAEQERDELSKRLRWYRAAHLLVANDMGWLGKRDGEDIRLVSLAHDDKYDPLLLVMCSDTFAYACADAERAEYADAEKLLEIAKSDGWVGLARWVQERWIANGEPCEPIEPVKKMFASFDEVKVERDELFLNLKAVERRLEIYRDASNSLLNWLSNEPDTVGAKRAWERVGQLVSGNFPSGGDAPEQVATLEDQNPKG